MAHASLTSGQWYSVEVQRGDDRKRIVLDEKEYADFYDRIKKEERYVKIDDVFYFWSDIREFGPIKFEEGVLTKLKELPEDCQTYIKAQIKKGSSIFTIDSLRRMANFFLNEKENQNTLPQ